MNRAYDDLVLFCDKDGKYYLNDNYPNYWNLEKTKQNADKRSEGWNKFINLLRKVQYCLTQGALILAKTV